jgi:hypothetical protein
MTDAETARMATTMTAATMVMVVESKDILY